MDTNNTITVDLHLHTSRTDGHESPSSIMQHAKHSGLKVIALTEHIDLKPSYDWHLFESEIRANVPEDMKVYAGVEAKVLDALGTLNAQPDILKVADIVLGSVHGEGDVLWLLKSACDIIAHPQITDENIGSFLDTDKILEINPKPQYELDSEILSQLVAANRIFSFGSNTHVASDLSEGNKYFDNILKNISYNKSSWS